MEPITASSNIYSVIKTSLAAYNTYKQLMSDDRSVFQKIKDSFVKRQFYDVNEVFNEVENGEIAIGDTINLAGYLLRYGQGFKPYTHVNQFFANAKYGDPKYTMRNGKLIIGNRIIASSKVFQPPVQSIPSFNGIGCAFLFDERFKTFEHIQNPIESERENKPIIINEFAKPIIVLYDQSRHEKHINKRVSLKGKVVSLDKEAIQALDGIFDDTIREICSNFFRPFNEYVNFICISTVDKSSMINEIGNIKGLLDLKASLFVETQLEDLNIKINEDKLRFIKKLIPDLITKKGDSPIDVMTVVGNLGTPFLTTGDIQVLFREPEVIGFYTETHLFEPEDFKPKLQSLVDYINNFSIEYAKESRKMFGEKKGMYLNFLYDYQKQFLFDKRGVLCSRSAKELYDLDDSSKYVQEWLKNDRESSLI